MALFRYDGWTNYGTNGVDSTALTHYTKPPINRMEGVMIYITLTGTSTASGCGHTIKTSGKASPLPKLARQLIQDGYAAHDITEVKRNGIVCFMPTSLGWWVARDIVEGDAHPVRVQKHKPFDAQDAFWG